MKLYLAELRVGINNIRMISNGGSAIETSSVIDTEAIKTALQKENDAKNKLFTYKSPIKRKPTVVVYRMDKDIPPEEVPVLIVKQNGLEIRG